MKYTDYLKEAQESVNKIIDDYKVFFAFSHEQFEKENKEDKNVVAIFPGVFVYKEDYKDFNKAMDELTEHLKVKAKLLNPEEAILYELKNHEAFYTGEIEDTYESVKDYEYTYEQVNEVYQKHRSNY